MKDEFKKFCDNIKLTANQKNDAKTKYQGVAKKLHESYYDTDYDGSTKLLFGSYKTKTHTRPLSTNQDVDVLFKIPQETFDKFDKYESNGQSALLQEVKALLNEKYSTTDDIKGWGKVILVKFADNTHNVEVLPAFELDDNTFLIPNSENGGSWEAFDPRKQLNAFNNSSSNTDGLSRELTQMLKTWVKNTSSLDYKSYKLLTDVIEFLKNNYQDGEDYDEYHNVLKDFLDFLKNRCSSEILNYVNTAYNRVIKALEFMDDDKPKEASEEWRKIFGLEFPKVHQNPEKECKHKPRIIVNPANPWSE